MIQQKCLQARIATRNFFRSADRSIDGTSVPGLMSPTLTQVGFATITTIDGRNLRFIVPVAVATKPALWTIRQRADRNVSSNRALANEGSNNNRYGSSNGGFTTGATSYSIHTDLRAARQRQADLRANMQHLSSDCARCQERWLPRTDADRNLRSSRPVHTHET